MLESIENYIKTFKEKKNLYVEKNVSIIGSPLGAGQPLGGVQLACDDLRKLGLHNVINFLGWKYEDLGNIEEHNEINKKKGEEENVEIDNRGKKVYSSDKPLNGCNNIICEPITKKYLENDYYSNIKNIELIGKFSERLFHVMSNELKKKNFVLNIGGDHSVAFASILSSLQIYKDLRVIWIDAHGDINTPETSPSGNYHGMPLAHSLGLFKKKVPYFEWSENLIYLKPENLAIIGIRDIDTYEKIILKKYNINYYTIFDVEQNGIYNTILNALKRIDPNEKCPIHISLDIDSVDNIFAPGTGTIAKGGLTYREINLLMKILSDTKRVVSMDLVEYNPSLDEKEKKFHGDSLPISENATKTGKLCLELIARVLGYDIV
ncbi:arginase, putative [Plasmodium gallinaceum]|uniref:Arginase n=1 Tax=Plasmodium gallinaceum TaxID=5849 RepID=A0A1J1GVZ8_PLAGA|nr:arginase, putative [Plasmodium gallinaceum]CRG96611.1 arginase, putative [Plasmodium gallinaceum]